MTRTISRRNVIRAVGFSAVAAKLTSESLHAQSLPVRSLKDDYKEDLFYREDWLGEPWRKPEAVVLIHGNDESSEEWYAWVPRMAQEYRVIRPDLPGLGHSNIPRGLGKTQSSVSSSFSGDTCYRICRAERGAASERKSGFSVRLISLLKASNIRHASRSHFI